MNRARLMWAAVGACTYGIAFGIATVLNFIIMGDLISKGESSWFRPVVMQAVLSFLFLFVGAWLYKRLAVWATDPGDPAN